MPIYAFECKDCDTPFEKLLRSSVATVEVSCPECGGKHVQKRLSLFAARVQGGTTTSAKSAAACNTGGT